MGLCLPDICTTKELSELIIKIFKDRLLAVNNLYNADYQLLNVKNLKDNYEYLYKWNNITVMYENLQFTFLNYFLIMTFFLE